MSDAPPPKTVSRYEANLLRILRFVLKPTLGEQAPRHLDERLERPKCLSAAAVHLVEDSLAKGCVLYLVRSGGWRRDRVLRNGEPVFGRLWARSPVEKITLTFSKHALDWLMWLTAYRPKDERPFWTADERELTTADRLLLFLSYQALRADADIAAALRSSSAFSDNALIWLAYPNDFAGEANAHVPAFDEWLTEPGSLILEALQPELEERWLEIERTKGQIGDWAQLNQQGQVQGRVIDAFTQAVQTAGRRDLARFLLVVVSRMLATPDMPSTFWTGGLQGAGPPRLAERVEAQRNALVVLRTAERFRVWERQARATGYLDDDYAASKFWLGELDRFNFSVIANRAEQVLQQVEPLRIG